MFLLFTPKSIYGLYYVPTLCKRHPDEIFCETKNFFEEKLEFFEKNFFEKKKNSKIFFSKKKFEIFFFSKKIQKYFWIFFFFEKMFFDFNLKLKLTGPSEVRQIIWHKDYFLSNLFFHFTLLYCNKSVLWNRFWEEVQLLNILLK